MTLSLAIAKWILGPTYPLKREPISADKKSQWYQERACMINALAITTALVFFVFVAVF